MSKQLLIFFIIILGFCVNSHSSQTAETNIESNIKHRPEHSADNNDALINERFSVDRALLEKHWHIDCDHAVENTLIWLTEQKNTNTKRWGSLQWKDLNYCGLLFNTANTGRYEPCPDYLNTYQLLLKMRQNTISFDPQLIRHTLSTQCKN